MAPEVLVSEWFWDETSPVHYPRMLVIPKGRSMGAASFWGLSPQEFCYSPTCGHIEASDVLCFSEGFGAELRFFLASSSKERLLRGPTVFVCPNGSEISQSQVLKAFVVH